MMLRSIRGATTILTDSAENVLSATNELLKEILQRNDVVATDITNIIFTTTNDISSEFPAVAARGLDLSDVPLLDCQQMHCDKALKLCIRILLTYNTTKSQKEINHVYLHGARVLRPDLLNK